MADTSVESKIKTSKHFEYKAGAVTLAFDLNIDNNEQLEDFHAYLAEAFVDIDKILHRNETK